MNKELEEALEFTQELLNISETEKHFINLAHYDVRLNLIKTKQALLKAQENEKENANYKSILDALKNHLHILPMSNGNDVIGIGCPSNEDVIEPNDFGYDIIKEWLKKDRSE